LHPTPPAQLPIGVASPLVPPEPPVKVQEADDDHAKPHRRRHVHRIRHRRRHEAKN